MCSGTTSTYWYGICLTSSAIQTRCVNGQYALPYRTRSVSWECSFAVREAEPDAVPETTELCESFVVEGEGSGLLPEAEVAFWGFLASLAALSRQRWTLFFLTRSLSSRECLWPQLGGGPEPGVSEDLSPAAAAALMRWMV
jgi:hypothetical protein